MQSGTLSLSEIIGKMTDGELTELLRLIAEEIEMRMMLEADSDTLPHHK